MLLLEHIFKTYYVGDEAVHALDDASLHVKPKEFVAICGPSGSGKTTLMNVMGCLDMPDSGRYILDGVNIAECTDKELSLIRSEKIGFVFQQFNLSVAERTREIGIRKAIGARRSHIMMQFLIEACVLSILGGLIGLGLSAVGLRIFEAIADMTISIEWRAAVAALLFCVIIGVAFGSYPAAKASKMTPIEALQRN